MFCPCNLGRMSCTLVTVVAKYLQVRRVFGMLTMVGVGVGVGGDSRGWTEPGNRRG
jgi:hypothetical protein